MTMQHASPKSRSAVVDESNHRREASRTRDAPGSSTVSTRQPASTTPDLSPNHVDDDDPQRRSVPGRRKMSPRRRDTSLGSWAPRPTLWMDRGRRLRDFIKKHYVKLRINISFRDASLHPANSPESSYRATGDETRPSSLNLTNTSRQHLGEDRHVGPPAVHGSPRQPQPVRNVGDAVQAFRYGQDVNIVLASLRWPFRCLAEIIRYLQDKYPGENQIVIERLSASIHDKFKEWFTSTSQFGQIAQGGQDGPRPSLSSFITHIDGSRLDSANSYHFRPSTGPSITPWTSAVSSSTGISEVEPVDLWILGPRTSHDLSQRGCLRCPCCKLTLSPSIDEEGYENHLATHWKHYVCPRPACAHPSTTFPSLEELFSHEIQVLQDDPSRTPEHDLTCSLCHEAKPTRDDYRKHWRKHYGELFWRFLPRIWCDEPEEDDLDRLNVIDGRLDIPSTPGNGAASGFPESPPTVIKDQLRTILKKEFRDYGHPNQQYIPRHRLVKILSHATILRLIEEEHTIQSREDQNALAAALSSEGKHLALVIYYEITFAELWSLIKEDKINRSNWLTLEECKHLFKAQGVDESWWYNAQFQYLPLRHSLSYGHVEFPEHVRPPFEDKEKLGEGGSSDVFKVVLNALDHDLYEIDADGNNTQIRIVDGKCHFALKIRKYNPSGMSPAAIKEYEREKEMLRWIRHPNIVRLSQSFTIDHGGVKEYCMLLPLAECSLFEYLRESTATSRQERLAFMLEHLSSITDAIEYVHRKYKSPSGDESTGFNHDIKPRNILLFQSRDGRSKIFRLCDWGLGQFHGLESGSGTTVREPSDPAYTPPERDVESGLGIRKVSRSADVWSWGCVILEILVWITSGPGGVENFFKEREREYHDKQVSVARFWDVLPNANGAEELQPNPAVVRMFKILRQDSDDTCRGLLSVVESMVKLKADDRIPIEEAVNEIYKIRQKATYS